jgi:hypothetical protein
MKKESIREQVLRRSQGHCEAMVRLDRAWVRCGKSPVDDHHVLPRGRGGSVLDAAGETYHHLALCRAHHQEVDERGASSGLIIEGYVRTDAGQAIYVGPDLYLSSKYGKKTS